jgi:hypothetical protein
MIIHPPTRKPTRPTSDAEVKMIIHPPTQKFARKSSLLIMVKMKNLGMA